MRLAVVTVIASMCIAPCLCAHAQAGVPESAPASQPSTYSTSDENQTVEKSLERGPLSGAEGLNAAGIDDRGRGFTTSLRYSQLVDSSVAGAESSGYAYSGAVSGQFGFYANSEHRRTMLSYDGGGMFHTRANQDPEQFHNFNFSEAFDVNRWSFLLANDIGYASQGSYGGGLPGISNIGPVIGPGQVIPSLLPNQDVLTFDNPRITDAYIGQAQYQFSRRNSMTAVFSYGLMHFFNSSQMDSRQIGGSLGFDRKVSALSTLALKYSFQRFSYNSAGPGMNSHSPQLMYERRFSSRLSAQLSAGPQLVSYSTFGSNGLRQQTSVMAAGSASLLYQMRDISTTLSYSRDVNGGSGLVNGARADTVSGSATRTFARQWHAAVSGGYTRTSAVALAANFNSRFAGGQLSRDLGRSMGIYFSYTMQSQSYGAAQAINPAYNGIHHVFGIGFDWHRTVPVR